MLEERQIGLDQRVGEDHQHRPAQVLLGQLDGVRLADRVFLHDEMRFEVRVVAADVLLDLLAQVADDGDQLDFNRGRQGGKGVDQVVQHGLAGHAHQLLGLAPGVRAQARPQASHRNDDF